MPFLLIFLALGAWFLFTAPTWASEIVLFFVAFLIVCGAVGFIWGLIQSCFNLNSSRGTPSQQFSQQRSTHEQPKGDFKQSSAIKPMSTHERQNSADDLRMYEDEF